MGVAIVRYGDAVLDFMRALHKTVCGILWKKILLSVSDVKPVSVLVRLDKIGSLLDCLPFGT